jgi:dolichyl-phosphate beta-glucosyltransferase
MSQVDLSVILPAYNCASFIHESVEKVSGFCGDGGLTTEIIVVDDGSTDGTAQNIPGDSLARVIRLPENKGKGAAVRSGMLAASGRVRLYTDADLPYGTSPIALAAYYILNKGYHAVFGDRTLPGSLFERPDLDRRSVSLVATWIIRTFVTSGMFDTQCGFKAFAGDVAEGLFSISRINGFAGDTEVVYLLLKHRLDIKRVPVVQETDMPSTIRLARDSVRAGLDLLLLRYRSRKGLCRSEKLERILEASRSRDRARAQELWQESSL